MLVGPRWPILIEVVQPEILYPVERVRLGRLRHPGIHSLQQSPAFSSSMAPSRRLFELDRDLQTT